MILDAKAFSSIESSLFSKEFFSLELSSKITYQEYLFPGLKGKMSERNLQKIVKSSAQKAGLKKLLLIY